MFADLVEELLVTDDDVLVERLRTSECEVRRLCAEQAAMLREVDRRGLFCDDGHRSVKGFLKANLNWSNSQVVTIRADGTEMRPVGQRSPRERRREERAGRPTMHPDVLVAIRECFATRTETTINAWPTVGLTLVDGHYRRTG